MKSLIYGYGITGKSFERYLIKKNIDFDIYDINISDYSSNKDFSKYKKIYCSPGIPREEFKSLKKTNKVLTDIDIFLKLHSCTKILITGTNGKTTVTSMSHKLFSHFLGKKRVEALGNIGNPVLDNIDEDIDIALIEVSSYQLELSSSISSDIAVLLNVTQDHLDRHSSLEEYKSIKNKVFIQSKLAIREGQSSSSTEKCIYFQEIFKDYDYCFDDLKYEWPLHDVENIKATISILFAYLVLNEEINFYDKPQRKSFIKDCLRILNSYQRLPHRYEILDLKDGVTFINDSKATNVASVLKALESVYDKYGEGKAILICGGDSKGQDFQELTNIPEKLLKKAYIFGIHKDLIAPFLINTDVELVRDMKEAMKRISLDVVKGDVVILSPACASTDMYKDYEERGEEFRSLVGSI